MADLCIIEGDGISAEVIPAVIQVAHQVIPHLNIHTAYAGWNCFQQRGTPLPQETIDLAKKIRAILFIAADSPSIPVQGYYSPIIRLRRILKTYANLRPTRYLPVPTARVGVDLFVVRENTEDLYISEEQVADDGDTGTATKIITRKATERIAHMAYWLAKESNYKQVTIVHKGNVFPQTDGLFRKVALEIAELYPNVETDELLVDTAAYWMVKNPSRFNVILTSNMYGDILSDMAAAWGGGLGLAPALNLGDNVAIAEPVHGAAPDIAGKGVANPTAAILSFAMLVRFHWGQADLAQQIEDAVYHTLSEGYHTMDIPTEKSVSTVEFTNRVCEHLQE